MMDRKPPSPNPAGRGGGGTGRYPSVNPAERDFLERLLNQIKTGQDELRAEIDQARGADLVWKANVNERLDEHQEDLRRLKDVALNFRSTELALKELTSSIQALTQNDVVTTRDLGDLKSEFARLAAKAAKDAGAVAGGQSGAAAGTEAGNEAGARAGGKRAAYVGAAVIAWEILQAVWPLIKKAITQ